MDFQGEVMVLQRYKRTARCGSGDILKKKKKKKKKKNIESLKASVKPVFFPRIYNELLYLHVYTSCIPKGAPTLLLPVREGGVGSFLWNG